MSSLPTQPDLDQLRRQAKDLLRAARAGDTDAIARVRAVSDELTLAAAKLALAREHGVASWPRLKDEVDARTLGLAKKADEFIQASISGNTRRAAHMLEETPALATHSFATAVTLGDADRVRADLQQDSTLATRNEMPLTGGRVMRGVVRVGETVRRPMPADPDYVHGLLDHLQRCGFEGTPRFLGADSQGREILTYIQGTTLPHNGFRLSREAVAAGARLVRRVHDLTAGTEFAAGSEVACHLNLSQPNFVFRELIPIAIIDWDITRPGSRVSNLADFLWAFVHPGMYDNDEAAEMLRAAVDAYGWTSGGLVNAMLTTVRTFVELNPEFRDWGIPELEHLERNAELFRKRLNE